MFPVLNVVLTPVAWAYHLIAAHLPHFMMLIERPSVWMWIAGLLWVADGCVAVFAVFLWWPLFRKSRNFPRRIIAWYVAGLAVVILHKAYWFVASYPYVLAEWFRSELYWQILFTALSVVMTFVWIQYFIKSKRVASTFVADANHSGES